MWFIYLYNYVLLIWLPAIDSGQILAGVFIWTTLDKIKMRPLPFRPPFMIFLLLFILNSLISLFRWPNLITMNWFAVHHNNMNGFCNMKNIWNCFLDYHLQFLSSTIDLEAVNEGALKFQICGMQHDLTVMHLFDYKFSY